MRRLPPLNALRAFEAAARHSSFTRAANELSVTHGAVSRQIALLERWLGTPLFRRLTRKVVLTDEATGLLEVVGPAFERISRAAVDIVDRPSLPLFVNAPPTFTMRWLIPRLSVFQRRSPGIEVRLSSSIDPIDFSREAYDLAIRRGKAPWSGLESRAFLPEDGLLVCSPDLLEGSGLRSVEDLGAHTLIHTATEPDAWSDWLGAAGSADVRPRGHLTFEQLYYALQAAIEGLGVAVAPFALVADDVAAGRLAIPLPGRSRTRNYFAVHQRNPHKQDSLKAFCDWLEEEGAAAAALYDDVVPGGPAGRPARATREPPAGSMQGNPVL